MIAIKLAKSGVRRRVMQNHAMFPEHDLAEIDMAPQIRIGILRRVRNNYNEQHIEPSGAGMK